jgi:hypothetical protein
MAKRKRIELSEEELEAVIDFNVQMAKDAEDSEEFTEAKQRWARAAELTDKRWK